MNLKKTLPMAPGPFYVKADCCTACGLPDAIAPNLFGTDDENSCVVKKQPTNVDEIDRMLLTMITAEFGCIRYAGANWEIRRRLAEQGEALLCDIPPEQPVVPLKFDHAGIKVALPPYTLDALVTDFEAFLSKHRGNYRFRIVSQTAEQIDIDVGWYKDEFHSVTIRQANVLEFDWLVVGLPFLVHDWLTTRSKRLLYGFFTANDWNGFRSDRRRVPW